MPGGDKKETEEEKKQRIKEELKGKKSDRCIEIGVNCSPKMDGGIKAQHTANERERIPAVKFKVTDEEGNTTEIIINAVDEPIQAWVAENPDTKVNALVVGYKKGKKDYFDVNSYGMVELPVDDPNASNGQYTFDGHILYKHHNRNDEKPGGKVEQDTWGTPENVSKFINLAIDYTNTFKGELVSFGDLSTEKGKSPRFYTKNGYRPHASHFDGSQVDMRYPTVGGQTSSISQANIERTQWILDKAASLGMNRRIIGTKVPKGLKNYTNTLSDHNNHIHIGSK